MEGVIQIGIDVKRIEARRDIHKRCDEIVNKAAKLKALFPQAKFGVVIYYPFIEEQVNIQNRLRSNNIDSVVFASASKESINWSEPIDLDRGFRKLVHCHREPERGF
jgi:hypothetical protein